MNNLKIIDLKEFLPYFIIGGIATLIDWSVFSAATLWLGLHYQLAVTLSYSTAGIMHYISNKYFTFQCKSKQIGSQLSVYIVVGIVGLTLSMLIIGVLIDLFAINKIWARVLTTVLMLVPNYLMHKHLTFSKKIFV
jgi:putative flippase GtrA